jgi:hypothetical protein
MRQSVRVVGFLLTLLLYTSSFTRSIRYVTDEGFV